MGIFGGDKDQGGGTGEGLAGGGVESHIETRVSRGVSMHQRHVMECVAFGKPVIMGAILEVWKGEGNGLR